MIHLTSTRRFDLRTLLCLVTLLFAGVAAAAPAPQSEGDLRKENQSLKAQLKQTQDELALLKTQMTALQQQLATLQQQLAAARSGKPVAAMPYEEPPVTIDESVPSASPRALMNAVMADYNTQFADGYDSSADQRTTTAYLRALKSWTQRINREHKRPITWHVRVLDMSRQSGDYVARVLAVDPQTATELGRPFDVTLSRQLADRVNDLARSGDRPVIVIKGVLEPAVLVNEDRMSRGTFDTPPYIGPMAEFGYRVDVQTVIAPEPHDAEGGAAGPAGSQAKPVAPANSEKPAEPAKPAPPASAEKP